MFNNLAYNGPPPGWKFEGKPVKPPVIKYGRCWSATHSCFKSFRGYTEVTRGKYKDTHVWIEMVQYPALYWVRVLKKNIRNYSDQEKSRVPNDSPKTYTLDGVSTCE